MAIALMIFSIFIVFATWSCLVVGARAEREYRKIIYRRKREII